MWICWLSGSGGSLYFLLYLLLLWRGSLHKLLFQSLPDEFLPVQLHWQFSKAAEGSKACKKGALVGRSINCPGSTRVDIDACRSPLKPIVKVKVNLFNAELNTENWQQIRVKKKLPFKAGGHPASSWCFSSLLNFPFRQEEGGLQYVYWWHRYVLDSSNLRCYVCTYEICNSKEWVSGPNKQTQTNRVNFCICSGL